MKTVAHDKESVTCSFTRSEYLTLVESIHFLSSQYDKLDAVQLDIERQQLKQLVSELENCTPAW